MKYIADNGKGSILKYDAKITEKTYNRIIVDSQKEKSQQI